MNTAEILAKLQSTINRLQDSLGINVDFYEYGESPCWVVKAEREGESSDGLVILDSFVEPDQVLNYLIILESFAKRKFVVKHGMIQRGISKHLDCGKLYPEEEQLAAFLHLLGLYIRGKPNLSLQGTRFSVHDDNTHWCWGANNIDLILNGPRNRPKLLTQSIIPLKEIYELVYADATVLRLVDMRYD